MDFIYFTKGHDPMPSRKNQQWHTYIINFQRIALFLDCTKARGDTTAFWADMAGINDVLNLLQE